MSKIKIDLTNKVIVPPGVRIHSSTDKKGLITGTNPAFLTYSGFSYEELNGQNHNIIRHPDMPAALFHIMWDVLKSSRPDNLKEVQVFVKNKTRFGGYYWVLAKVYPTKYDKATKKPLVYMSARVGVEDQDLPYLEKAYSEIRKTELKAQKWNPKNNDCKKALEMSMKLLGGEAYAELIKKYN